MTQTHQTNEQEHCPTCSLARFSSSSLLSPLSWEPAFPTPFSLSLFFLEEEKQAAFTKISPWLLSLLCAPLLVVFFCFVFLSFYFFWSFFCFVFTFKATRKDSWIDGGGVGVTGQDLRLTSGWAHSTQEELSTRGCKWTAGVISLVWMTFLKEMTQKYQCLPFSQGELLAYYICSRVKKPIWICPSALTRPSTSIITSLSSQGRIVFFFSATNNSSSSAVSSLLRCF